MDSAWDKVTGDGSVHDFLMWSLATGHYQVRMMHMNYTQYCEYMRDKKAEKAEELHRVESD